jgi:hypothetical protein
LAREVRIETNYSRLPPNMQVGFEVFTAKDTKGAKDIKTLPLITLI